jgi:hypothetical protein
MNNNARTTKPARNAQAEPDEPNATEADDESTEPENEAQPGAHEPDGTGEHDASAEPDENGEQDDNAEPDAANDLPKEARLRKRAQDAEARANAAEDNLATLAAKHDQLRNSMMSDHIVQAHGVKPAAVVQELNDVPGEGFNEDGTIDRQAVADAVKTAQDKFGLAKTARGMRPNPAQGTSGAGTALPPASFADAFKRGR